MTLCSLHGWLSLHPAPLTDYVGIPAIVVTGPTNCLTCHFFTSSGRDHCRYLLHLPMEGWPGWVDLSDSLNVTIVYLWILPVFELIQGDRVPLLICAIPLALSHWYHESCETGKLTYYCHTWVSQRCVRDDALYKSTSTFTFTCCCWNRQKRWSHRHGW